MTRSFRLGFVPALATAVSLSAARTVSAQLPIPSFSIAGGVSHYSLSGSGTAPIGVARVDIPLLTVIAEGSLAAFRPTEDGDVHRTYVIPEAQLQFQVLPVLIRPYFGVGAGWFKAISGPDPHRNDLTLSASAGVRAGIPLTHIGVRGEIRLRSIGGFSDHAAEFTLGVSW